MTHGANAIRTSIDLPRELHRRLHEAAARKGCSRAADSAASNRPSANRSCPVPHGGSPLTSHSFHRLDAALISPNEELYDLIEFP